MHLAHENIVVWFDDRDDWSVDAMAAAAAEGAGVMVDLSADVHDPAIDLVDASVVAGATVYPADNKEGNAPQEQCQEAFEALVFAPSTADVSDQLLSSHNQGIDLLRCVSS